MARFDFRSPGAAFTNEITEALAQRKAEERQLMLDQLTVNADARAQEAAARQAEAHKLQLAQTQQQMGFADEDQGFQRMGVIAAGMDPDSEIPAEHLDMFKKYSWARELPNPQVSTETSVQMPEGADPEAFARQLEQSTAPAGPTRYGYVGNAEQREKRRQQKQSGELVASLIAKPETRQVGEMLGQLMLTNDGVIPEAAAAKFLQPDRPLISYDVESGETTNLGNISPHAEVITRSRPPRQPLGSWMYQGDDKQGNSVYFHSYTGQVRRDEGISRRNGAGGGSTGNTSLGSLNIPNSFLDDIKDSMTIITGDPRAVSESSLAGFRNAMSIGFNEAKINASPQARQLASQLLNKGKDEARQYIEQQMAAGTLSTEEVNDALSMYSAVPQHVRDVLSANPYDPNPKPSFWQSIFGGGK